jgi:hypothetical protein
VSTYAYRNEWRKRNSDRVRAYHRKSRTGWTADQYDLAYVEQGGCCYLCRRHASELPHGLVADHCHESNTPRRLLCDACNTALGLLRDDAELIRRAANYIEQFQQ